MMHLNMQYILIINIKTKDRDTFTVFLHFSDREINQFEANHDITTSQSNASLSFYDCKTK